uniref:Uncharacterized protein n=1 Tax=Corvus moneduloides TaxID=1196302 RepID=A0A8U7MG78_CORMO
MTGEIYAARELDYETGARHVLQVSAEDTQHGYPSSRLVLVQIHVQDCNDQAPTFPEDPITIVVPENAQAGSSIFTFQALDGDGVGPNSMLPCYSPSSLLGGDPGQDFSLDPISGVLSTAHALDREQIASYSLIVVVQDHGSPPRSATMSVTVQVLDLNDNAPGFAQATYMVEVPEDLPVGDLVLQLVAGDADLSRENAGFDYTIVSGNGGNAFQVESRVAWAGGQLRTQGALVLVESLDFESIPVYNLTVAASDRGLPQRSATVPVLITVQDVNDNPPVFTRAEYRAAVSEAALPGTELLRVAAHDADSGPRGRIHYTISSGDQHGLFQLHESTGALSLARPLDREVQALHTLVVRATDIPGGHFALVPVAIEVKDINDNKPYFPVEVLSASIRENLPPGTLVTTLRAIDADTGTFGELRYMVLEQAVGDPTMGDAPCANPSQPSPKQSPSPASTPRPSSPRWPIQVPSLCPPSHHQAGPSRTHPPCAARPSATRVPFRPPPCRPASPHRCPRWPPAPPWSRPSASRRGHPPPPSALSTRWSPLRRPSSGFRAGPLDSSAPARCHGARAGPGPGLLKWVLILLPALCQAWAPRVCRCPWGLGPLSLPTVWQTLCWLVPYGLLTPVLAPRGDGPRAACSGSVWRWAGWCFTVLGAPGVAGS